MAQQKIPDKAWRVVVPLANPATARGLLDLALALAEPDGGEVIAVVILKSDPEEEARILEAIEPIVESYRDAGQPVSLRTPRAPNISRGILDAIHENAADLLVLGLRKRARGEADLGPVVRNVLTTATCDVVIYRPPLVGSGEQVSRVVVPADGTVPARVAGRLGLLLAEHLVVPIEAMYAQESYLPHWEGLGRMEHSFEGMEGAQKVRRTLIAAHSPEDGVLARLNHDDLLVVGYSGRSTMTRFLIGSFSERMLNEAPCAVMLASRAVSPLPLMKQARRFVNRFVVRLTPTEQSDMMREAYEMAGANIDYLSLITIAALLASLGLLLNSPAVIIGAMLVAPFMQPCIAFAIGVTTGRISLMLKALSALAVGVPLALAVAVTCGLLLAGDAPTGEMLARGNPSLLDALVALASGIMGAYATARKDIPAALAGVAIAAALMPPLCTAGLELAAGRTELGLRAALLFLTNIVCISLAAWGVFLLVGMRPLVNAGRERRQYISAAALTLLALPLVLLLLNLSASTNKANVVRDSLSAFFTEGRVTDIIFLESVPIQVRADVETPHLVTARQVREAETMLKDRLGRDVNLEIVVQRVVYPLPDRP